MIHHNKGSRYSGNNNQQGRRPTALGYPTTDKGTIHVPSKEWKALSQDKKEAIRSYNAKI